MRSCENKMFVYYLILFEMFTKNQTNKQKKQTDFAMTMQNQKSCRTYTKKIKISTVRYTWYEHSIQQILNYYDADGGDKSTLRK